MYVYFYESIFQDKSIHIVFTFANSGPVWHSSASPVELFFKNNFMSNFMSGGESHVFAASPCA
jgi:UDP-glucose 4-epimerase